MKSLTLALSLLLAAACFHDATAPHPTHANQMCNGDQCVPGDCCAPNPKIPAVNDTVFLAIGCPSVWQFVFDDTLHVPTNPAQSLGVFSAETLKLALDRPGWHRFDWTRWSPFPITGSGSYDGHTLWPSIDSVLTGATRTLPCS